jgi:phosphoribosyl-AMP cyclohydrolase
VSGPLISPRGDAAAIEAGDHFMPKFDAAGLIPVVTQDAETGVVLMLAWMNAEAIGLTLETGRATYWSRSRGELWVKGETSGHTQAVVSLSVDCDQDALLLRVRQIGPACHTGAPDCFYRQLDAQGTLTRSP